LGYMARQQFKKKKNNTPKFSYKSRVREKNQEKKTTQEAVQRNVGHKGRKGNEPFVRANAKGNGEKGGIPGLVVRAKKLKHSLELGGVEHAYIEASCKRVLS